MTVSGAAPATPKNTTEGTPSRFWAKARDTMSGPAGSFGRDMFTGLQAWMLELRPRRIRWWRPRERKVIDRLRTVSLPCSRVSSAMGSTASCGEDRSDRRLGVVDQLAQVGGQRLHDVVQVAEPEIGRA